LAETIQSAVAKQITDELQGELSRKKNAAVQPTPTGSAIPKKASLFCRSTILAAIPTTLIS
jgi:hypothetical protein